MITTKTVTPKNVSPTLELGARVKKNDMVNVEGTGVSEFLPYKKEVEVHRMHAQTLIKAGKAKLVS
jgi:hypothetical protein